MNRKWIAVFTENDFDRQYLCKAINTLFDGLLEAVPVTCRTAEQLTSVPLAVVVNWTSNHIAKDYFPESHILYVRRVINGSNLEQVINLPANERVLVVNKPRAIAEETVQNLKELGVAHLQMTPFWPGSDMDTSDYGTVVFAGFQNYCPEGKKRYIDIGFRSIAQSSLAEMIKIYDLPAGCVDTSQMRFTKLIVDGLFRVRKALNTTRVMKENFEQVCFLSKNAILNIDANGQLLVFNPAAEKLFGVSFRQMIGKSYRQELRSHKQLFSYITRGEEVSEELIYVKGNPVLINIRYIKAGEERYTSVSLLPVEDLMGSEEKVRTSLHKQGLVARHTFGDIKGSSTAIRRSVALAQAYSKSDATVLITGESGTGKELFAQSIHQASPRAQGPFVAANFAAIPENLIESELFGYDEGAFTGAVKGGKPGLFRSAHTGTLFLDEIGDASLSVQSRLLRAIEEQEIMPVGSARVIPVDVHIICATNQDLPKMVAEGKFREDLYYRIKVFKLHIPPLRDRREDIPLILDTMTGSLPLPPVLRQQLMSYSWPGNIRELRGLAQYISLFSDEITHSDGAQWEEILFNFFEQDLPEPRDDLTLQEEDLALLACIRDAVRGGRTAGRCSLSQLPAMQAYGMTESRLKLKLKHLEKTGYVRAGRTRQGVILTEAGFRMLDEQDFSKPNEP